MSVFYRTCDLFVMASRGHEGLPLVLLEAMAAGVPVVSTRCAGADEAVRDGRDGLLVPACEPEALSRAIGKLASDSRLRRSMGEAAAGRALDFSVPSVATRINDVYARVLAEQALHGNAQSVNA